MVRICLYITLIFNTFSCWYHNKFMTFFLSLSSDIEQGPFLTIHWNRWWGPCSILTTKPGTGGIYEEGFPWMDIESVGGLISCDDTHNNTTEANVACIGHRWCLTFFAVWNYFRLDAEQNIISLLYMEKILIFKYKAECYLIQTQCPFMESLPHIFLQCLV
jgi:hypothetical protein